jgi:hypothetical protein
MRLESLWARPLGSQRARKSKSGQWNLPNRDTFARKLGQVGCPADPPRSLFLSLAPRGAFFGTAIGHSWT